jgi:hypothetical protein
VVVLWASEDVKMRSFIDYLTTRRRRLFVMFQRRYQQLRDIIGGPRVTPACNCSIYIYAFESRCRLDERQKDGPPFSPAMNDEAESSGAVQRHGHASPEPGGPEDEVHIDEEEVQRLKDQLVKERRLDAKRKRIRMLNELLRELDLVVYMQLITVYHFEYGNLKIFKNDTDMHAVAARSSGLPSKLLSMASCSRPQPTRLVNAHQTSLSHSCL